MDIRIFARMLKPLRDRVAMMLSRGLLEKASDDTAMQLVKVSINDAELLELVEHLHAYGLSSNCPSDGGEVVVGCCGGNRDSAIALTVGNSKFRPKNLKVGEVVLYSKFGQTILLKEDGSIVVTPKAGKKLVLDCDVEVTKTLTATTDVVVGTISLKSHVHPATSVIPTVGGVVGTNAGNTLTPM